MNTYPLDVRQTTLPADLETPVGIYLKVRDLYPQSVLLESSDYHTAHNSVSYIGVNPIGRFSLHQGTVTMQWPDGTTRHYQADDTQNSQVVSLLRDYLDSYRPGGAPAAANGLFGFTSYDAVRYFEDIRLRARDNELSGVPVMMYVLFRFVVIMNHYRNQMTIVENVPEGDQSTTDRLLAVIRNQNMPIYSFKALDDVETPLTDSQFRAIICRCIDHCRRGDVFQIVPSRRFSQGFRGDEFNVYRALRSVNPSPYLFYFDFGAFKVFGSSPETHMRVQGRTAYIDPIAGTFRRTGDDERDKELARALLLDEKENAEHIMLVDLARNDLARGGGLVEIDFLRQVQFYSHVIHLVSRVKASIPEGVDPLSLYAGSFPAGTLSGAPKVRAMQIIDELEPHARSVYGGCIGYIGFDGNLNQAITIRSFLSYGDRLYSQAGMGVVAHSNPDSEVEESNNKLAALRTAVSRAENF